MKLLSEKRKAYKLNFEKEPPKAERKGRGKEEYKGTIDLFIESGREFAEVKVPAGEKLSNVSLGLKHAIERMGRTNELKAIRRKGALFLVTKAYSDKREWAWKVKRKNMGKGVIAVR